MLNTPKRAFEKYTRDLGITLNDLRGKKIADLGCGDDALFVRSALDQGILEITGVDTIFKPEILADQELKSHIIQEKVEDLSLRDLDLILAYGSVGTHPSIDLPRALAAMFKALKFGGEMRIFPLLNSEEVGVMKPLQRSEDVLLALKTLPTGEIECDIKLIKKGVTPEGQKYSQELLIVRKKFK